MTDFDLPSDLYHRLTQAIFGGPALPDADRAELARQLGVEPARPGSPSPGAIVAVAGPHLPAPAGVRARALHLHPGLTYLLTDDPPPLLADLRRRGLRHSQPQPLEHPGHWVAAIQRAIVDLRRQELAELTELATLPQRAMQLAPGPEAENEARRLALSLLRRQDTQWPRATELWLRIVMQRHQRVLNEVRRKLTELFGSLCQSTDSSGPLAFAFQQAVERTYRTHLFGEFPAVLEQSLRELLLHIPSQLPDPQAPGRHVAEAIAFLRAHLAEPISLRDVAEAVHLSPSHLARRFREATGVTLLTFLHRLRTAHARQHLAETDDSVLEVALACGFDSPEHFHRIFKRETGLTPHRYRVRQRG